MAWKDDEGVAQNLKRSEILNFVQRDYGEYRWSSTTLDRNHTDSTITPQGGHSITKHTGEGWLEGLRQKPQNTYPKIAIFKKC